MGIHHRGCYIIDGSKVLTFFFSLPPRFRSSINPDIVYNTRRKSVPVRHEKIQTSSEEAFGHEEATKYQPVLKPVYAKNDRCRIIGWEMTFPHLHPKFFAKFRCSASKGIRRRYRTSIRKPPVPRLSVLSKRRSRVTVSKA